MNKDKALMRLFKVDTISYLIAKTSKGELQKSLRINEDEYYYTLDSVPLSKEQTEELLKILNG